MPLAPKISHMKRNHFTISLLLILLLQAVCPSATYAGRRKAKKEQPKTETISDYKKLTGRDSVVVDGVANIICKADTFYLEIPRELLGRQFLVTNKMLKVPQELNDAGVNKGIVYDYQTIRFEWDSVRKKVEIRQQRLTPEAPTQDAISTSVQENYIDPILTSLKVEALAKDSSTIIIKVNDLFNGKQSCLNDVFNAINLGTSPKSDLSHIISIKAFEQNITATSELTTTVTEGNSRVNITVVVATTLTLLPEKPMARREESPKVGYFTTSAMQYSDKQQAVDYKRYITRWRLEPKDEEAYLRGELTEPVKPIVFYIDPAMPAHLKPYVERGILDWNTAFEKAGFKNAVEVRDYTDSIAAEGDDMRYSLLTYAASEKANAMGPSTIDPRTGEILEADIIWWHNVQSLLREWIMVQTGAINPAARTLQLPDSLIGDAARFVACHEVGHSLGLRHNMRASNAYPTDSLRSRSFTTRMGGTSASIMDYARFNYVAQPEDNIVVTSPHIGPYDLMAIEWGYRWFPCEKEAKSKLYDFLQQHKGALYRYSEAQSAHTAIDPRALSEDLGDNAMKSARYGIANLKRIVPEVIARTTTGEPGQSYDEAAKLHSGIIYQWSLYLYHVMANIGGVYLENVTIGDDECAFTFVEKERQKDAVKFLLDEVLCYPAWLFDSELFKYTYMLRNTPIGVMEQHPHLVLRNQQNYILWDLLHNDRLVRMLENEMQNGKKAFTVVEMMDMLHNSIFAKTIAGKNPDVMERSLQKSFVDALITAAAESEGVKINKKLYDEHPVLDTHNAGCFCCSENERGSQSLSLGIRIIEMSSGQINRNSDAISVKRGELIRVMKLMKSRLTGANTATKLHYEDVILRIQTALGLHK